MRALVVNLIEGLVAALLEDPHAIDDRLRAGNRAGDALGKAQIGLHRVDLPDAAHGL